MAREHVGPVLDLSLRLFTGALAQVKSEGVPMTKDMFISCLRNSIQVTYDLVDIVEKV